MSLKSLANIGPALRGGVLQSIQKCFLHNENPAEIRITALNTLRLIFSYDGSYNINTLVSIHTRLSI